MAESTVEDPTSNRLNRFYEGNELELFSVELMSHLMKHFKDDNYAAMPKLSKSSKHYSNTILKSVSLAWRITHDIFSQRFEKALLFMRKGRRQLFMYASYQAEEFFDNMEPHVQLVYLAAYCYELSNFLSRNGLEEYICVSYSLFSTIWRDQYQKKFEIKGGWERAEKELNHYAKVFDRLEDIFMPEYPFSFSDLLVVQSEYEMVKERILPGNRQENRNSSTDQNERLQRRMVTPEDRELDYLDSILDFKVLKFLFKMPVFPPEKLIGYLKEQAIKDENYSGRKALLKFYELEDTEVISGSLSASGSDDSTLSSTENDDLINSTLMRLHSFLIHNVPDLLGIDLSDASKK